MAQGSHFWSFMLSAGLPPRRMMAFRNVLVSASLAAAWPTELPSWPYYPGRKVQVLDGEWSFGHLHRRVDAMTVMPSEVDTPDRAMVPSNFDLAPPGEEGFRGTVAYRTQISLGKDPA